MKKILLVEDDQNLGYILKEYLTMNDFEVSWEKDGLAGATAVQQNHFDLCVLDIMMPKKDGFTLAREIRESKPTLPFIFLSSKSLKIDKLKGFKLGGDDYIVKPVDEEELIARINAVLRRSGHPDQTSASTFTIGLYQFNAKNQQLKIDQRILHLTQKENEVLMMLSQTPGLLVERDYMLQSLWGDAGYFKRRSMDVVISKLRKMLAEDPDIKIMNVHGKGYILSVE